MTTTQIVAIIWMVAAIIGLLDSMWLLWDTVNDQRRANKVHAGDDRSLAYDPHRIAVIHFYFAQEGLTVVAFLIFLAAGIDVTVHLLPTQQWVVFGLLIAEIIFMLKTINRRWYRHELNKR